jgi:hypothetical protein
MALFIDTSQSTESAIFQALLEIARCDPGLTGYPPEPGYVEVSYAPENPVVPSSKRLLEIVNSVESFIIIGVTNGYVTPDGPIIDFAAFTDVALNSNQTNTIYIDVSDAGGQHYLCLDSTGKTIWAPLPVILYHELAHAYHYAIRGDAPHDLTDDQTLAIKDENDFRTQLGLPLRYPLVSTGKALTGTPTRGGLTFPKCKPPAKSASLADLFDGTCVGCNIATAALGSPVAREIVAFRKAKRDFAPLTLGSVPLLEPMMNSYQLFSPIIAGEMRGDPDLRDAMLRYGVQPAVYLLRVVQTYASGTTDDPYAAADVERTLNDYVSAVSPITSAPTLAAAADAAFAASRALAAADVPPSTGSTDAHRRPDNVFSYIADAVRGSGAETSGSAWILEGLAIFLREAGTRSSDGAGATSQLIPAVGAWLAQVPIPKYNAPDGDELRHELIRLGERLFPSPPNREVFAQRLLAQWPRSPLSLEEVLSGSGYVSHGFFT